MSLDRDGKMVFLDDKGAPGTLHGWVSPNREEFTLAAGQKLPDSLRPFLEETTEPNRYRIEADGGTFGVVLDQQGVVSHLDY